MLRLLHTVAAGPEVIGAPQQAGLLRRRATIRVSQVDPGRALRGLVNNSNQPRRFSSLEVEVAIMVG